MYNSFDGKGRKHRGTCQERNDISGRICGKHLAAKRFTRHYKTGACDKYAEANPSAAVEAAAYYNSRFGKDDVVADSMGGCVLSQSEFSALQSQLVYHDRVTDEKESGDY